MRIAEDKLDEVAALLSEPDGGIVVVDDFLPDHDFMEVRDHLVSHWGWRYKNWANAYLHNYQIGVGALDRLADRLSEPLSEAAARPVSRVAQWAILAHRDEGLKPHADNGTYVVNFWLTPDEFNLDPESGGMVLFDVCRPRTLMSPEFQISPESDQYVSARTQGKRMEVSYRCNRAVIFDATIFHSSMPIKFSACGTHSKRLNVSMIFDDPQLFDARRTLGIDSYRTNRGS